MMTSKVSVLFLAVLASTSMACAKKKTAASAASATTSASTAVEDRSAKILGYWMGSECTLITDTSNKDLHQALVFEIKTTSVTLKAVTFLDDKCTQPVFEDPANQTTVGLAITGAYKADPNLIGIKTTDLTNNSVNYSSVLIDGAKLHFTNKDSADEANRADATTSDMAVDHVDVPAGFSNSDSIALNKSYLSACMPSDEKPSNGKSLQFVLSFNQAGKQITAVIRGYNSNDCSGAVTLSKYPPLDYESLFLKSTTYGSHTEIQGYAPRSGGKDTMHFRIHDGLLTIDGTVPGQPTEGSTLTEI